MSRARLLIQSIHNRRSIDRFYHAAGLAHQKDAPRTEVWSGKAISLLAFDPPHQVTRDQHIKNPVNTIGGDGFAGWPAQPFSYLVRPKRPKRTDELIEHGLAKRRQGGAVRCKLGDNPGSLTTPAVVGRRRRLIISDFCAHPAKLLFDAA